MRLSWYSDTGVAVFSIWQGGTCTGTFRLPIDDLPRMVEALQRGPRGAALPAGEARDQERGPGAERQRRGITAAPTEAMPAVASLSDYATGQIAPVTGEFRPMSGPAEPTYRADPLGSGAYPAYRATDRDQGSRDRGQDSLGGSFPGYADDGPPVYRDSSLPPGYGDDPLGARGYRDDPSGSGGYPAYREPIRAPEIPGNGSQPGPRDSDPYRGDPLGSGYRSERPPPSYREDPYPPSYRNEPAPYPAADPGQRYSDDPFQSVYPEDSREPGYPDDGRAASHPYGPPPGRTEPRVPRGRS